MMKNDFYSVGIDVGTTTTQVVFSRLFLEKTGSFGSIPSVRIAKKEVVFKSAIHFTPLVSHDIVDAARLRDIVAEEYRKSTIHSEDVTTGAVIITGESARKENAQDVTRQLADLAGDFVVCTAGPDYEAVLAGWGSGAGEISKRLSGNIINFDIGGGTTNAAVFQNGNIVDAFAADIGGRLIKVNSDGLIIYVSEKINFLIEALGLKSIQTGCRADIGELSRLTARMAEMFLELIGEQPLQDDTRHLFIDHAPAGCRIDRIMFSGGVSEFIYSKEQCGLEESLYRFGDIGPLLGLSIRKLGPFLSAKLLNPTEKIRATVVGAGSYSTALSGSTIAADEAVLPLKSIPVIKFSCADGVDGLGEKIKAGRRLYDGQQTAVAIDIENPGYPKLKRISEEILKGSECGMNPVIVITECDCAKGIGLLLRNQLGKHRPIICLDKIHSDNGDFIDIGKPISGVVPVIVKTLIFSS